MKWCRRPVTCTVWGCAASCWWPGEHPKFVSDGYMQECLDALHSFIPSLGLEIGPLPDDRYAEIVRHGAEQLAVYQETYNREVYETPAYGRDEEKISTGGWIVRNAPIRAVSAVFR